MDENTKKFIEDTVKETVDDAVKTAAETQPPKKKKKISGLALYMLGSVVVTAGMSLAMPKLMNKWGQHIYTASLKKKDGEDDWAQEILNRNKKKF